MSVANELDWIVERGPVDRQRRRTQDLSQQFYYMALPGMSELMDACHAVFNAQIDDIDIKHYGCRQDF